MSSNPAALTLYRRILRLHRRKLPFHMRDMGDRYVKKEFRDHREAKPEFVSVFMREWTKYADSLESQKVHEEGSRIGQELSPDVVEKMSDDQKQTLARLREEATQFKPTPQ